MEGLFDITAVPEGWVSQDFEGGWFDADLLEAESDEPVQIVSVLYGHLGGLFRGRK
jgi:hypothetical protein